jgi:hypothetical protein
MEYRITGIENYIKNLFFALNQSTSKEYFQKIYKNICDFAAASNNLITKENINIYQLNEKTQQNLNFISWLINKNNYEILCEKLQYANNTLKKELKFKFVIKIIPTKYIWRIKKTKDNFEITINIGFLAADQNTFNTLLNKISSKNTAKLNDPISKFILSKEYLELNQIFYKIEKKQTKEKNSVYDLEKFFFELNEKYFHNEIKKPLLKWSKKNNYCKFGEYIPTKHEIIISKSLDNPKIPELLVKYILYHEMLHIKYPTKLTESGFNIHHQEFKFHEKKYENYQEAEKLLHKIAKELRLNDNI